MKPILKRGSLAVLGMALLVSGCHTLGGTARGEVSVDTGDVRVQVTFSDRERAIIRDYFARHGQGRGLPPGLAKRRRLPPGLERQLRRNGRLPPGLEKHRLPPDLERRLRPLPRGYARAVIGAHVVLVDERTGTVVDILYDVVL